jgi:Sporulation related domain.
LVQGNFKGLEGVRYVKEDGWYKYFLGDLEHYAEAEALRQKVRQAGYRDAFVIGLLNGRKISALEARKMLR